MGLAQYVVILGIDGLRPDMVTPATMPALHALMHEGAAGLAHRTVYPSETRGALTALVSGARPETTGVLGNEFHARGEVKGLTGTNTVHDWGAAQARLTGGMVTAPGLSEVLAKAGRRLAVVTSSGQGSMTALSWTGRDRGHAAFNVRHPQISFPHTLAADIEAVHGIPPEGMGRGGVDAVVDVFTRTLFPAMAPAVSILWLTEVDSASHRFGLGAEPMLESMTACDRAVARLREWRAALGEDVALIVTSDHGHATIGSFVSVTEALEADGLPQDGVVMRRGRAPAFWLERPDAGLMAELAASLAEKPWAGALFSPGESGATEGCVPGTLPLALTGAGHRRGADLVVQLAGSGDSNAHGWPGVVACDASGYGTPLAGGTHGGMHPAELTAVLAAEGGGFVPGAVAARSGIQDLVPTALHLVGVPAAPSMSGRVLTEMTGAENAPPETVTAEARLGPLTSRIAVSRIGGTAYVDMADGLRAGEVPAPPQRRPDLVVIGEPTPA